MGLTVFEARERMVCRVCERPVERTPSPAGWSEAFFERVHPDHLVLCFGAEFAHGLCLSRDYLRGLRAGAGVPSGPIPSPGPDPSDMERLASVEHESWSRWATYMLDRLEHDAQKVGIQGLENLNHVRHRRRQAALPYSYLTADEQESDRKVVREKLPDYRPATCGTATPPCPGTAVPLRSIPGLPPGPAGVGPSGPS